MNKKSRWMVSIITGIVSVPARYAASLMLCGPNSMPSFSTLAALVLIP